MATCQNSNGIWRWICWLSSLLCMVSNSRFIHLFSDSYSSNLIKSILPDKNPSSLIADETKIFIIRITNSLDYVTGYEFTGNSDCFEYSCLWTTCLTSYMVHGMTNNQIWQMQRSNNKRKPPRTLSVKYTLYRTLIEKVEFHSNKCTSTLLL